MGSSTAASSGLTPPATASSFASVLRDLAKNAGDLEKSRAMTVNGGIGIGLPNCSGLGIPGGGLSIPQVNGSGLSLTAPKVNNGGLSAPIVNSSVSGGGHLPPQVINNSGAAIQNTSGGLLGLPLKSGELNIPNGHLTAAALSQSAASGGGVPSSAVAGLNPSLADIRKASFML